MALNSLPCGFLSMWTMRKSTMEWNLANNLGFIVKELSARSQEFKQCISILFKTYDLSMKTPVDEPPRAKDLITLIYAILFSSAIKANLAFRVLKLLVSLQVKHYSINVYMHTNIWTLLTSGALGFRLPRRAHAPLSAGCLAVTRNFTTSALPLHSWCLGKCQLLARANEP